MTMRGLGSLLHISVLSLQSWSAGGSLSIREKFEIALI